MNNLIPINQAMADAINKLNGRTTCKPASSTNVDKPASKPSTADLEKVQKILIKLDPDIDYTDWVRIGMVLHYLSEGTEEGFEIWDSWSNKGDKYPGGESLVMKYAAFHSDPETCVKMGTLIYIARMHGVDIATAFKRLDEKTQVITEGNGGDYHG